MPNGSSVSELAVLGKLFEEHRGKLLAMLRCRIDPVLQPRLDAEEVLQDAYLAARHKWLHAGIDRAPSTYAWLYRIALDTLIETWRKQTRECRDPRREMPWPERSSLQMGLDLLQSGLSPSVALVRQEELEEVRAVLGALRPGDREILWMRHYDELSFGEAAAVLGVTENAATVRYVRALRRLRDEWQRRQSARAP